MLVPLQGLQLQSPTRCRAQEMPDMCSRGCHLRSTLRRPAREALQILRVSTDRELSAQVASSKSGHKKDHMAEHRGTPSRKALLLICARASWALCSTHLHFARDWIPLMLPSHRTVASLCFSEMLQNSFLGSRIPLGGLEPGGDTLQVPQFPFHIANALCVCRGTGRSPSLLHGVEG